MIKQLREKIKERLETLSGEGQPLSQVYEYLTLEIEGYPCAMVHFDRVDGEFGDSCHNNRIYQFIIYIMQETKNRSREQGYESVEDIMIKIMNVLDKDQELSVLVDKIRATAGDVSEYSRGSDGEYVGGIITLQLEKFYYLGS